MFFQTVFVSLLLIFLGAALCLAGFRVFVVVLPLFAFFAGFIVMAQAIQELFGGGFLATAGSWVIGFVVGLICAVIAYLFYYGAVVVLAWTVGYELGVGFMTGLGVSSGFLLFIVGLVLALALAAAVIFFNLPKLFIIALTALAGASMILTGILLAVGRIPLDALHWGVAGAFIRDSWFWGLAFLAIAGSGMAAQVLLPERYSVPEPYGPEQMAQYTPTVSASGPTGQDAAL